ncbi:hypothetical protein Tsubulata_013788 [Turnera subulata]|uniref:HMA domain-containing protein n=1 Tax=Turnera subulata TaxID=218843 RepID=A0A9Q0JM14_9ROSI|nr:hypothetical protein Tsubulata_013788 [Turnera subulata]
MIVVDNIDDDAGVGDGDGSGASDGDGAGAGAGYDSGDDDDDDAVAAKGNRDGRLRLCVVELRVRLHCKACEKAVRKNLCRIKGVTCVQIDSTSNKITVLGYVDRRSVVKAVWRTGRRAEVLPVASSPSSSGLGLEAPSPRLPTGFRCIIPRWGFIKRA